jgi:uncharacterized protein DUF6263
MWEEFMKPLRLAVASAAVALVTLGGSSLLGQEGVLKYRWNKGDVLRYRIVTQTNAAMTGIPGMGEMTVNTTLTQVQQLTTQEVAADGTATIQNKFESVKMETATPMGSYAYDSAAPPQNTADPVIASMASSMGALVGESITLVMSPDGSIQKMEGMTRIMEKMKQNAPQAAGFGLGLDSVLSDDAMKGMFGQNFGHFPATPVKPGDTWKHDLSMPNPFGIMHLATTFSVKGVETTGGKELVRIASTSTIKATAGDKAPPMPVPMTIQFNDGTGDGEMIFDRKLGRNQRASFNTTLPLSMSMTGPDGSQMSIQALTKTTTTMELIEK